MGGRGASSGGGTKSTSNAIKNEMLSAGLNSKLKGVQRDAREGTGNYTFKNAQAVARTEATKMDVAKIREKNGNTLVEGMIGGRHVFYANKSGDSTIQALKAKQEQKHSKVVAASQSERPEIKPTSTYNRWKKRHDANFAAWFGKR